MKSWFHSNSTRKDIFACIFFFHFCCFSQQPLFEFLEYRYQSLLFYGIFFFQHFHLYPELDLPLLFYQIIMWSSRSLISPSIFLLHQGSLFCPIFRDFSPNWLLTHIPAAFGGLFVMLMLFILIWFITSFTSFIFSFSLLLATFCKEYIWYVSLDVIMSLIFLMSFSFYCWNCILIFFLWS